MQNGYNEIIGYFKSLADSCVYVNDFVGFSEEEFQHRKESTFDNPLQNPYLQLLDYSLDIEPRQNKNTATRKVVFGIAMHNIKPDDYTKQKEVIAYCEDVAKVIVGRVKHDANDQKSIMYRAIDDTLIVITPAYFDNESFGVTVAIPLKSKSLLQVLGSEWADLDLVCGDPKRTTIVKPDWL